MNPENPLPWILPPPFSPKTFEFPLGKRGKRKEFYLFPGVSPHPERFVNKEERMVLNCVLWLSLRLGLEVGLTRE